MDVKPLLVGYYRADHHRMETAIVGDMVTWCTREGYALGTPYRDDGTNGALDAVLDVLRRDDVQGVIVPSLAHLGPLVEEQVSRIRETGKQLLIAEPTQARR